MGFSSPQFYVVIVEKVSSWDLKLCNAN